MRPRPTKDKVLEVAARYDGQDINPDRFLRKASGHSFYNTSTYTLKAIAGDASHAAKYLNQYYGAFSPNAREVLERYDFAQQIKRLDQADLLYQVVGRFADLDLRPVERTRTAMSCSTRMASRSRSSPTIRWATPSRS